MNSTRPLGALELAAGGSLLLSEPLIGRDLLTEVTGIQANFLWIPCMVAIVFGLIAITLGHREEKEFFQDKGGAKS